MSIWKTSPCDLFHVLWLFHVVFRLTLSLSSWRSTACLLCPLTLTLTHTHTPWLSTCSSASLCNDDLICSTCVSLAPPLSERLYLSSLFLSACLVCVLLSVQPEYSWLLLSCQSLQFFFCFWSWFMVHLLFCFWLDFGRLGLVSCILLPPVDMFLNPIKYITKIYVYVVCEDSSKHNLFPLINLNVFNSQTDINSFLMKWHGIPGKEKNSWTEMVNSRLNT